VGTCVIIGGLTERAKKALQIATPFDCQFLTENFSTFRPYRLQASVVLQEREDLQ